MKAEENGLQSLCVRPVWRSKFQFAIKKLRRLDIWERIANPFRPKAWLEFDQDYYRALCAAAGTKLAVLVKDCNESELISWKNACLVHGLVICCGHNPAAGEKGSLNDYFERILDQNGFFRAPLQLVDDCQLGWSLLEMLEWSSQKKYSTAAHEIAHFLLRDHPRSRTGTLPYVGNERDIQLADTLGMVCPFLVRYGLRFGVPEAVELAVRQMTEYFEHGIESGSGLACHAYNLENGSKSGVTGWTRGAGWVAIGLADSLAELPKTHDCRLSLCRRFEGFISVAAHFQRSDGCWPWQMRKGEWRVDTSGTAFLGYAIARGVQSGSLPQKWESKARKAMEGIVKHTTREGSVESSLAECLGVGIYPQVYGEAPWTQGLSLALAVLMMDGESGRGKRNHC